MARMMFAPHSVSRVSIRKVPHRVPDGGHVSYELPSFQMTIIFEMAEGLPREDSVTATPSRMYQFSPSGTVDISGN